MYFVGTRLIPWLLVQVARHGSSELFTLAVLAMALGIAFGAASIFGVSFALGAFVAGLVVSESDLSHRAATDAVPFRDAFAVLFFVSVGMLFDPGFLLAEPLKILAVVAVIVVGKALAAAVIVLVVGYPLRTGLVVAAGLAQVGEFSFILAALGTSLNLLRPEARDLVLAGALFLDNVESVHICRAARGRALAAGKTTPDRGTAATAVIDDATRQGALERLARSCSPRWPRPRRRENRADARAEKLPFVVIERDGRLVDALRARAVPAVLGDATAPGLLEAAGIATAEAHRRNSGFLPGATYNRAGTGSKSDH